MLKVLNDTSFIHQVVGLDKDIEDFENIENGIL
jgi:hypothetical protein